MHALFLRKLLPNQLIRNNYSWGNLRASVELIFSSGRFDGKFHRSRILHAAAGIQSFDADDVARGVVVQRGDMGSNTIIGPRRKPKVNGYRTGLDHDCHARP